MMSTQEGGLASVGGTGRSAADNSAAEIAEAPKVDARMLPDPSWNELLAVSCSALLSGVRYAAVIESRRGISSVRL